MTGSTVFFLYEYKSKLVPVLIPKVKPKEDDTNQLIKDIISEDHGSKLIERLPIKKGKKDISNTLTTLIPNLEIQIKKNKSGFIPEKLTETVDERLVASILKDLKKSNRNFRS